MRASSISQFDGAAFSSSADQALADCNEEQLIAKAKSGSHAAFEKLVESYQARVFRVARVVARSHEDAEDVVQQSFRKAFVHLPSFEGRSSFSTWLTRIALNEALMLRRSNRRFRHISIDDSGATDDVPPTLEIPDSRPNPEHCCSQRERRRLLLSAINKLKPGIRIALQMRDLDERSVADTARILGVSVSAVKSRLCRGRRELREKLKNSHGIAVSRGNGPSPQRRKFQSSVSTSHSDGRGATGMASRFSRSPVAPPDTKASPLLSSDCFASTPLA